MSEKLILPNEFLAVAEEELKNGKSVKILADGTSMFPFIHGGKDFTEIVPLNEKEGLVRWNAYFFNYNGKYIIHRFIEEDGDKLVMMGDGNIAIQERVDRNNVIGTLKYIHSFKGSTIDCTTTKWRRTGKIWHKLKPTRRYLLALIRRMERYGII